MSPHYGIPMTDYSTPEEIKQLMAEVIEVACSAGKPKTEGQRLAAVRAFAIKDANRAFHLGLALAGYSQQKVKEMDHRAIVFRLMDMLDQGIQPDVREVLEAYGVDAGKPMIWASKVFVRTFEKYMRELFPELLHRPAMQQLKEIDMLDQTQKANLIAATFTGFAAQVYKGGKVARDLEKLKQLAVIDRQEKEELRARVSRLEARMSAVEKWQDVADQLRDLGKSYGEIAEVTGIPRYTVISYLKRKPH